MVERNVCVLMDIPFCVFICENMWRLFRKYVVQLKEYKKQKDVPQVERTGNEGKCELPYVMMKKCNVSYWRDI